MNDELALAVARKKAQKHYKAEFASDEDYQFSVFMLILAQVHHALMVAKLQVGLNLEMKNCSTLIRQAMIEAGFVIAEIPE